MQLFLPPFLEILAKICLANVRGMQAEGNKVAAMPTVISL